MGAEGHEAQTELHGEHIGHGVHMRFVTARNPESGELERAGVIIAHRHEDGAICEGIANLRVPANVNGTFAKWDVRSWDPLTLDPSIEDRSCGLHGYIREGRWEPA